MQTYTHTYIHTYIHTYLPPYLPTHRPTYIPTYIHTLIHSYIYGWLSKLWSLFGSRLNCGTYYLVYPKRKLLYYLVYPTRNLHFDNHPYMCEDQLWKNPVRPSWICRRHSRAWMTLHPGLPWFKVSLKGVLGLGFRL